MATPTLLYAEQIAMLGSFFLSLVRSANLWNFSDVPKVPTYWKELLPWIWNSWDHFLGPETSARGRVTKHDSQCPLSNELKIISSGSTICAGESQHSACLPFSLLLCWTFALLQKSECYWLNWKNCFQITDQLDQLSLCFWKLVRKAYQFKNGQ